MRRPGAALIAFWIMASMTTGRAFFPPQDRPPDIAALLEQYASGDANAAVAATATARDADQLRQSYTSQATTWVKAANASEQDRRRLIAAAFGLEIAHARLTVEWQSVRDLVEWGCRLLRESPSPLPAERHWHLAAVAIGLRASDLQLLGPGSKFGHFAHAMERFPSDERLRLSEVVSLESAILLLRPKEYSSPGELRAPPSARPGFVNIDPDTVVRRLAEFDTLPAIRAEAQMRRGWRLLSSSRPAAALPVFEAARTGASDPYVQYLTELFSGWALDALKRKEEAEERYKRALSIVPGAQSASLSLSTLLFMTGNVDAAYAIMATSFVHQDTEDPWRAYHVGDYRFWPDLQAQMRGAVRR